MYASSESVDDLFGRYGLKYRYLVTFAGMMASFAMVISGTVINVAIPNVMGAFGVGQDQAQLTATAFNIAMTTSQLLNAYLIAKLGQRFGFAITLIVFAIGSLMSGFAPDFYVLVLGRILQGVAAGIIQPMVMLTFFQVFPPDRRGFAMSLYSMGLVLAVAIGPPIGGLAIEFLQWRFIFFITLPFIIVGFLMGAIFMPSTRESPKQKFDWRGYILLVIAVSCLMFGLTDGLKHGWLSNYIVSLLLITAITGIAFIGTQLREGPALIDVSLFKNKEFATATTIAFIFGVGNFGTAYAVPVFMQLVQGVTALDAGLVIMPAALITFCLLPITGRMADRISPRAGIIAGLMFFAVGTAFMALADVNTPYLTIVISMIVVRAGMSFTMPFIMNTALSTLPKEKVNAGGGVLNFGRQFGGSMGTIGLVLFVQTRTQFHGDAITMMQDGGNVTSQVLLDGIGRLLGEAGLPDTLHKPGALHYLGEVIHAQATTFAFQDGFWVLVVAFVLAMFPAWLLKKPK